MAEEIRFQTGFRGAATAEPGLVMHLDGSVWLVAPDGSETQVGSGSGSPTVRGFDFAFDTPGLSNGVYFYTPKAGEILLDCWIEVDVAWDGITPHADFTPGNNLTGPFAANSSPIDMMVADGQSTAGLLSNFSQKGTLLILGAQAPERNVPAVFITDQPLRVVVSQNAQFGVGAFVLGGTDVVFPLIVAAGVNDEFIFTGGGGAGSPETFTVAAGSYATSSEVIAAVGAAVGSIGGGLFSEICVTADLDPPNGLLYFFMKTVGTAGNGNTITPGTHDVAVDLGFTGNPDTFANGTDGLDPGATQGSGRIFISTVLPIAI